MASKTPKVKSTQPNGCCNPYENFGKGSSLKKGGLPCHRKSTKVKF